MIERYTLPRMARIWTDENRFQKWLDIEVYICEAYGELVTHTRRGCGDHQGEGRL